MPINLNTLPEDITARVISSYLTVRERSTLALVSKTTQGLFRLPHLQDIANKLLLWVMRGEQDKAEKMLRISPELLMMTGVATDYSGRTFETTAFRYALWALDTRYMCNMMLDCLPCSEQGDIIKQSLLMQYNAQVDDGVDYELNGVTKHETHYDFSPLIDALQTYVNQYRNPHYFYLEEMQHQWTKVVGLAQRYVPAHVAQHYCSRDESFFPTLPFTFVRSLTFCRNLMTRANEFWYTPASSTSGLGVDFAILSGLGVEEYNLPYYEGRTPAGTPYALRTYAAADLAYLTTLCEVRTYCDLFPLMQRLESPLHKPGAAPKMG